MHFTTSNCKYFTTQLCTTPHKRIHTYTHLVCIYRVNKRNRSAELTTLLTIRDLVIDTTDDNNMTNNTYIYVNYTRKQGQVYAMTHPIRILAPSYTQLYLLRASLDCAIDVDSGKIHLGILLACICV